MNLGNNSKQKEGHHIQQVIKIISQTKLNGKFINYDKNNSEIMRYASKNDLMYRYNENISFCCYKTKFNDKNAILLLFIFILPGNISGSSAATDMVMNIVSAMETKLIGLDYTFYDREINTNSKIIGMLKLVRIINNEEGEL